jgi:hypothetical protein
MPPRSTGGQPARRAAPPPTDHTPTPVNAPDPGAQPPAQPGRTRDRVEDVDDPAIDAALDTQVDAAPPLPAETRLRLAWLLGGPRRPPRDHAA